MFQKRKERQRCLLFRDDRSIEDLWLPVELGYMIDDDEGRAWDIEPTLTYSFENDRVCLIHEEEATPLDLAAPNLLPDGISQEKLKTIGADSLAAALLQLSRQKPRDRTRMILWIALIFAICLVLMILFTFWQKGSLPI